MATKRDLDKKSKPKRKEGSRLEVSDEDLENLGEIHELLRVLNDPLAAGMDLAKHIERIPPLRERILRTARIRTGHLDMQDLRPALMLLGNQGVEAELLTLLEDLTIAKAERMT